MFPYGTFDEEGLREFLKMHEAKQTAYEVQCEREWFNAVEPIVNRPLCSLNRQQLHLDDISASDISTLKAKLWSQKASDPAMGHLSAQQLSTLVCDRWVTEDVMQQVFSLVNGKCQNKDLVYCAV